MSTTDSNIQDDVSRLQEDHARLQEDHNRQSDDLRSELKALRLSVDTLLTAFNEVRGGFAVIKWIALIGAGVAAIYAALPLNKGS